MITLDGELRRLPGFMTFAWHREYRSNTASWRVMMKIDKYVAIGAGSVIVHILTLAHFSGHRCKSEALLSSQRSYHTTTFVVILPRVDHFTLLVYCGTIARYLSSCHTYTRMEILLMRRWNSIHQCVCYHLLKWTAACEGTHQKYSLWVT